MNAGPAIVKLFCTPARHVSVALSVPGFATNGENCLPLPESCANYALLCAALDDAPLERLSRTICVLDLGSPLQIWDLLNDSHPFHPTWLAWRYPEVYWIFLDHNMDDLRAGLPLLTARMHFATYSNDDMQQVQALLKRHLGSMRAWFDPWELRRSALCHSAPARPGPYAVMQPAFGTHLGLVMDDEAGYAVFNAYLLYRRNIPVCVVATFAEFTALRRHVKDDEPRALVVLEDVELNYAGGQDQDDLMPRTSDDIVRVVDARAAAFGFASRPPAVHVYVSATVVPHADETVVRRPFDTVLKPVAGLDEPGILRAILPLQVADWSRSESNTSHCAPADSQEVAAALLVRARILERDSPATLSALHGALLSFEAERLLANRTYAMTMESMAMRHWFEATAECVFAGATDELTVAPRLKELAIKMDQLVYHSGKVSLARGLWDLYKKLLANDPKFRLAWMKLHKRRVQVANGMLEVLSRLRDVYGLYRKAEEEEHVLHAIRLWRVRLFQLKRPLSNLVANRHAAAPGNPDWKATLVICQVGEGLWRGVLAAPLYYVMHMLKPARLFLAMLFWIGVATLGYALFENSGLVPHATSCAPQDWLLHSAVTFIAMQQGIIGDPKVDCMAHISFANNRHAIFWCLTLAEMAVGYFHLGLLVAVLVQKITRK